MKVKVIRCHKQKYWDLEKAMGEHAEYVRVPGTGIGLTFKGLYTDHLKQSCLVPWPVDRPEYAQRVFADENCFGNWPVDEFEKPKKHTGLSIVGPENEEIH